MPTRYFEVWSPAVPGASWMFTLDQSISDARRDFAERHSLAIADVRWRWHDLV